MRVGPPANRAREYLSCIDEALAFNCLFPVSDADSRFADLHPNVR